MVRNVLQYLEASAARFPEKTALKDEHEQLTYSEYVTQAKALATFLAGSEIKGQRNKPVAVIIDRNIKSIVAFIGIVYSGNFYVPIDNTMPAERVELIYDTLKPIAVIDARTNRSKPIEGAFVLDEIVQNTAPDEALIEAIRKDTIDTDPLYGIFTSGSTGVPKGVVVCHRSVIDLVEAFADAFGFDETMIHGNQAPFDFDVSVKDIYNAMRNGATVVVVPKKLFMLPKLLLDFLNEHQINTMIWAVSALRIVSDFKALDAIETKPQIKYIMFSGEVMPVKALNYWIEHIPEPLYVNLYGPTEITCNCTYFVVDGKQDEWKALPIGKPFANTRILLLDEKREKLVTKPGETGELCVAGTSLALGYWNNKEKTDDAFFQDPSITEYQSLIYGTGDMAYYNENGDLVFASRRDFQIKHMGHRIELGEIEVALNAIPFIETSCCLYDEARGKIVCFYQSQSDDTRAIVKLLGTKLPKYMWPNIFKRYDKLPMNKNSKIDRVKLKGEM
ncbi:MAG: amino acid adenylation domain-containing protein [Firmicutes bacterium]|nr:amino acid adenylation domain-containing protein [Bacillota bacterium]